MQASTSYSTSGWAPFWLIQCFGWGFLGLVKFAQSFLFSGQPVGPAKLVFMLGGFAISLLLFLSYRRVWRTGWSLWSRIAFGVAGSLAAGAAWFMLCEWIIVQRGVGQLIAQWPHQWPAFLALYWNLTTVFLSWTAIYFGWLFWRESSQDRERLLVAETNARSAELEMLRYQLNPHFMFNALNSLRALIDEDPVRARRMVDELSEFLRATLLQTGGESVTLAREIEFARAYLEIERVRFEENLDFDISIDPRLTDVRVPSFLLHPLIENAVKHGRATSTLPLKIHLNASRKDNDLIVDVMNTGRIEDRPDTNRTQQGTGIGLQNIRRRLSELYPGRSELRLDNDTTGVHAILRLPLDVPPHGTPA